MLRRTIVFFFFTLLALQASAQYKVDRLVRSGEVALHYEDYVLSIQYFNQAIQLKPYLYRPWQMRGVAKFYLDDFVGAEADATEALRLNPYIDMLYDLRAISRIRQKNYTAAIDDYTKALALSPGQQNYWFNRALCRLNNKDYDQALLDVDTIIRKWQNYSNAYSLKAELYLHKKDTIEAARWITASLKINPYDADAWTTRAYIALARKEWKDAERFLSEVIRLKPKTVSAYVNRALARYNFNQLRGSMADYDMAIDLDPNNFLAHYNRGQLRMQLGDDNRAIDDFNFVIGLEPDNVTAIFNRALLLDRTGDLAAAIRDYTTVIDQFPNFWTGLHYRARCYRRLGQTAKAELDEFRILKAQMNKHLGVQQRWSKGKTEEVRKRSEIDPEKYNQLVVNDEETVDHDYKSEYRGRIQNRSIESTFLPMFSLSYLPYRGGVNSIQLYDAAVDAFNHQIKAAGAVAPLYIVTSNDALTESQSATYFQRIEQITTAIEKQPAVATLVTQLLERAVLYNMLHDYDAALNDLTVCLQTDSTSVLACWQISVVEAALANLPALAPLPQSSALDNIGNPTASSIYSARAMEHTERALKQQPNNPLLLYNRGNLLAADRRFDDAIDTYTQALALNPMLAEAYYNRALAHLAAGNNQAAKQDLSRAGELGLYNAYSLMKQIK